MFRLVPSEKSTITSYIFLLFYKRQKEICSVDMLWYLFSYWYYLSFGCWFRCIFKIDTWQSLGMFLYNILWDFLTVRLLKVTFPAGTLTSLVFISFHFLFTECSSVKVKIKINILLPNFSLLSFSWEIFTYPAT